MSTAAQLRVPMSRLRNFIIAAHVDHGKSTLSEAMIRHVAHREARMDSLNTERERGITIKAQTATMTYTPDNNNNNNNNNNTETTYVLNLIDTPGHIDFSFEVRRSLAAAEGALLLVDGTQGVQAQTLAHGEAAMQADLDLIPVVSKVDVASEEDLEAAAGQLCDAFGFLPREVLRVSAVSGVGVPELFPAIVERVRPPAPLAGEAAPLRAQICDAWYDRHRGVICMVRVWDGALRPGMQVRTHHGSAAYTVAEVGLLLPSRLPQPELTCGAVGYVITGMRDPREAKLGDTLTLNADDAPDPVPGFVEAKNFVFAGIYPTDAADFAEVQKAMEKLCLNDTSVSVTPEVTKALGPGFRCGFLGVLHLDVFVQRLQDEFNASVIVTAPSVPYVVRVRERAAERKYDGRREFVVRSAAEWPDDEQDIEKTFEPIVKATVLSSSEHVGALMDLFQQHNGDILSTDYLAEDRVVLKYHLPLAEVAAKFYSKVQALTSGFATFDYEPAGTHEVRLVRMNVLLNGDAVDALSVVCREADVRARGMELVERLKAVIDRQQYEIVIQAAHGRKIVARSTIKAFRKDVLTKNSKKIGVGDKTRKQKLLAKQKEGKKRMRQVGKIQLNQEAFMAVLKE